MTDIYKFGNTFEYRGKAMVFLYYKRSGYVLYYLEEGGIPSHIEISEVLFKKEAKLTGLSFENFVEMTKDDQENENPMFPDSFAMSLIEQYITLKFENSGKKLYRIAKKRKYL